MHSDGDRGDEQYHADADGLEYVDVVEEEGDEDDGSGEEGDAEEGDRDAELEKNVTGIS